MNFKIKYLDRNFCEKTLIFECENEKEFFDYIQNKKISLLSYKKINIKKKKEKKKTIKDFISFIYLLTEADINILDSLEISKSHFSKSFRERISSTISDLKLGKSLKESFSHISKDTFFLNSIEIGEESGKLPKCLKNLKTKYELELEIKKEIFNISLYPAFVSAVSFIIISILLKFVVPKFFLIYKDLGKDIPKITKFILKFSSFYEKYFVSILAFLFLLFIVIQFFCRKHKKQVENLILKFPFFNILYKEFLLLDFSQNMNTAITGGLDILKALKLASETRSPALSNEIIQLGKNLEHGLSLDKAFEKSSFFSSEYKSYVLIAEETGNLAFMFENVSKIYFSRVKDKTKKFLKILEPLSVIFIAAIIAVIILSVMFPIFRLGENIEF